MDLYKLNHVSYNQGGKEILNDIHFSLAEGEVLTIMGPSGSGKSSLLRLLSSLESPSEGQIFYQGKNLQDLDPGAYRQEVAYLRQRPILFKGTVEDNLSFAFKMKKKDYKKEKVLAFMEGLKLKSDLLGENVENLSGGEASRLAFIRSLILDPQVFLLDEPTSALDLENTRILEDSLRDLHQEGKTLIWVTHDLDQSLRQGTCRMTIKNGRIFEMEGLA